MTTTPTRRALREARPSGVRDRFDDVPEGSGRVGAHRGRRPRGRGWIVFAWAALAVGIIVGGGILALNPLFPKNEAVPSATGDAAAQKEAAPVTDPDKVDPDLNLSITVLNGSPRDGADRLAGQALEEKGWPVDGTADASDSTQKTTVVYYSSRAFEGVARGLVKELGVGEVQLSDAFPASPVTIVLGSDYKG